MMKSTLTMLWLLMTTTVHANSFQGELVSSYDPRDTGGKVVLRADQPGRISIGGAAFRALPITLPADHLNHDVVVVLERCSGREAMRFAAVDRTWSCADPYGPRIELSASQTVRFEIRIGPPGKPQVVRAERLVATKTHMELLPPGTDEVSVICSVAEHLTWRKTIQLKNMRRVPVHCDPISARRVLMLTANAPGARFLYAGQLVQQLVVAPPVLESGLEMQPATFIEAGRAYMTTAIKPGERKICAVASGHEKLCLTVRIGEHAAPTRVYFKLPKRTKPLPPVRHLIERIPSPEIARPTQIIPPTPPPESATDRVWPWVATVAGATVAGVGAWLWADGGHDAWQAREHLRAGVISEVGESRMHTAAGERVFAGQLVTAVGALVTGAGITWLLMDSRPESRGRTDVAKTAQTVEVKR